MRFASPADRNTKTTDLGNLFKSFKCWVCTCVHKYPCHEFLDAEPQAYHQRICDRVNELEAVKPPKKKTKYGWLKDVANIKARGFRWNSICINHLHSYSIQMYSTYKYSVGLLCAYQPACDYLDVHDRACL